MKTTFTGLMTLFAVFLVQMTLAQTKTITGTVADENGLPIPNVNITLEGTSQGTTTDFDGNFSIEAAKGQTLKFTSVGFQDVEITIGNQDHLEVTMKAGTRLSEVVVTALGVSREKRSLGYSTQEVKGDKLSTVKTTNFTNALSGRVAGLDITRNNNFGGSTNVVLRGTKSITGNNQALFVIDGVPISNRNTNDSRQKQAAGTFYDYGNAAADINPEDIASVNVLKGAAATALYGSRAANGVVIITTKKGKKGQGLGVTINSGIQFGTIDKSTFPTYQQKYGAGYAPVFTHEDIDGDGQDDVVSNYLDDASYGPAFDPSLMIYQWDAFDPASPNYMKKTPWVAAKHGPVDFFNTPVTLSNSVAISNGGENGAYRFSYGRKDQTGLMPNSHLHRNDFKISGNFDVNDKMHVSGFANYIKNDVVGRNSTGYSGNIIGDFRQWWETNVDVLEQKRIYKKTHRDISWNPATSQAGAQPIYWDNPYWTRYENYQNDTRNRFIGQVKVSYDFTDWFNVMGRISTDRYNTIQEERRAVGSVPDLFGVARGNVNSGYLRRNITGYETNYDLMLNFNKSITEKLDFTGLLGANIRRSEYNEIYASTAGGLLIPDLYSLQNGKSAPPNPVETLQKEGVDGFYGSVSFGYDNTVYLDATVRRDHSSTLPRNNSVYWYPSVSASYVFDRMLDVDAISFGKLYVGYAEVGNDAPFDRLQDTYSINNDIGTSLPITKNNPDLKPERTKSIEAGLNMKFLHNRIGFDFSFYDTQTMNEIMATPIPEATGFSNKLVNAGEVENRGIELSLNVTPVKTEDWNWTLTGNFSKNKNEVVKLPKGIKTIQLGSFQGGITIQAHKGEPFGVLYGSDYVYQDGQRVVDPESGDYLISSSSNIALGKTSPDWLAGISNTVSYKKFSLSFLIDMQHGGNIFSLDQYYGEATGLYPNSAFINDKGKPVRNTLDNGGGFINPGVNPDGSKNTTRVDAHNFGHFGYGAFPNRAFVYDASYIKLRSVSLSYSLPSRVLKNTFLNGLRFTITGRNLWIIHKNIPYADPEAGLSSGNLQGYITGALPTTRTYGFNVTAKF